MIKQLHLTPDQSKALKALYDAMEEADTTNLLEALSDHYSRDKHASVSIVTYQRHNHKVAK